MRAPSPLPIIGTIVNLPNLADYTLVSLDIEGWIDSAIEIGVAICDTVAPIVQNHTGVSFVQQNNINCITLRLRDITKCGSSKRERLRFGDEPSGIDNDPAATIRSLLENVTRPPILVVFHAATELSWIKKNCKKLLTAFAACIDVQGLAGEASTNIKQPHLRLTLAALSLDKGFEVFPTGRRHHRAANDAVYTLAILAVLLHRPKNAPPLDIAIAPKRPWLFCGRPKPIHKYPYTALIRTLDCTPLPPELDSAGKIYKYFEPFAPITAGTGKTHKTPKNKEQLSWSWICFATCEDLDYFIASIGHTTLHGGKHIFVETQYIPGVTLTRGERRDKQIEDGDRIREERRQARLDMAQAEELPFSADSA